MLEVTVKTIEGRDKSFSVPDDVTVNEFKEKIASSVEIPAEKQRLIFKGKVLKDDQALNTYDVHGKVVHVVASAPRPNQSGASNTTTSTNSSGPSSQRNEASFVMGPFAVQTEMTNPQQIQNMLQESLAGLGDVGRNARVSTRTSSDGSTVDVNINLSPNEAPRVPSEAGSRLHHATRMIRSAQRILDRLERGMTGNSDGGEMETETSTDEPPREASADGTETPPGEADEEVEMEETNEQETPASQSTQPSTQPRQPIHPSLPTLGNLIGEVMEVNRRLQPFMERYQVLLNEDPSYQESDSREQREAQALVNMVGKVLHSISHAYHNLSDLLIDFSRPPPRRLRAAIVVPAQVAHVNVRSIPVDAQRTSTTSSDTTSTSTSQASSTSTTTTTSTTPSAPTPNEVPADSLPVSNPVMFMEVGPNQVTINSISAHVVTQHTNTSSSESSPSTAQSGQSQTQSAPSTVSQPTTAPPIPGLNVGAFMPPPEVIHNLTNAAFQMMAQGGSDARPAAPQVFSFSSSGNPEHPPVFNFRPPSSNSSTASSTSNPPPPPIFAQFAQRHPMNRPQTRPANTSTSGATRPGTTQPGTRPGATQPGTTRPGTYPPGAGRPGAPPRPGAPGVGLPRGVTVIPGARMPGMPGLPGFPGMMGMPPGFNQGGDPHLPCQSRFFLARRARQIAQGGNHVVIQQGQQMPPDLAGIIQNVVGNLGNQPSSQQGASTTTTNSGSGNGVPANPPASMLNRQSRAELPVVQELRNLLQQDVRNRPASQDPPSGQAENINTTEMFLETAQALFGAFGQAATGGASPTLSEVLPSAIRDTLQGNSNGFSNRVIQILMRTLRLTDMIQIFCGNAQCLNQSQNELAALVREKLCENGEINGAKVEAVLMEMKRDFDDTPQFDQRIDEVETIEDIDFRATIFEFSRLNLRSIASFVITCPDGDANFGRELYSRLQRALHEFIVLCRSIIRGGDEAFERLVRNLLNNSALMEHAVLQQWMMNSSVEAINRLRSNITISRGDVEKYIKRKRMDASPVGSQSSCASFMSAEDQPVDIEPMDLESAEFNPSAPNIPQAILASLPPPPCRETNSDGVIVGSESWHSAVPQEWVPVITRDVRRQRLQGTQRPHSDAYMNGLPAKKRKIRDRVRAEHVNPSVILPEQVASAAAAANVQPITSFQQLLHDLQTNTQLHAAFETELENRIQQNVQVDTDFSKEKFPNTEKYSKKRKS